MLGGLGPSGFGGKEGFHSMMLAQNLQSKVESMGPY